jgi:hypothetical protein
MKVILKLLKLAVYSLGGLRKYMVQKLTSVIPKDFMEGCNLLGEYKAHGFGFLSGEGVYRYRYHKCYENDV